MSRREELVLLVALAAAAIVLLVLPVSADALIDLARYLARPRR